MRNYCARITYFLLVLLLLCPSAALAWGPITHLYLGNTLLAGAAIILPAVGSALKRWGGHFLYGSLSADFFVGKGYRTNGGKYHNWETAMRIGRRAETEAERAFAAGFLSHLAADTVAHGCFVPQIIRPTRPNRMEHLYWEWLADRYMDKSEYRSFMKSVCPHRGKGNGQFRKMDDFICEALALDKSFYLSRKTLYLYPMRVIASPSALNGYRVRNNLLSDDTLQSYVQGSLNAMVNVLNQREDSPFLSISPNYKHPKPNEN